MGKRALVVLMTLAAAVSVAAEERKPEQPDATRRMVEGLRTGQVGPADAAQVIGWILHEKEDVVARGLIDVLRSVDLSARGAEGERWNATARAMGALLERALSEAAGNRRRHVHGWKELDELVDAATPAVIAALGETDPAARETLLSTFRSLAIGPDPGVRRAAAVALEYLEAVLSQARPPAQTAPQPR